MQRLMKPCLRWAYILILYILLGFFLLGIPLPGTTGQTTHYPMLYQGMLRGAAVSVGFYPDSVILDEWISFVSAYATNCVFLSLGLLALWNVLYSRALLGRNHEYSARVIIWVFVGLHVTVQLAYAVYVFSLASYIWEWILQQPTGRNLLLLLPQALIVPFYVSLRLFCPFRIYHVFPLFARLRRPLGLRTVLRPRRVTAVERSA